MSLLDLFRLRFPQFVGVDDAKIQMYIDDAALIMKDKPKWLEFYEVALCYLVAHFLAVAEYTDLGGSGTLAPIKRKEVDGVVIQFALGDVAASFDEYQATAYGKRYLKYRKMCITGMRGI